MRHEFHHIAGREVLAGFLVVFLVEAPDQLLENRPHRMVVESRQADTTVGIQDRPGTQVDRRIEELPDQKTEGVGLNERGKLVVELELAQHFLHIRRKAFEVILEIVLQLLLPAAMNQIPKPKGRCVVEGFARRLTQGRILIRNTSGVQLLLHRANRLLRRFQHRIEPTDHDHGQNNVAVLATYVDIAQYVVGNAPNEVADVKGAHGCVCW